MEVPPYDVTNTIDRALPRGMPTLWNADWSLSLPAAMPLARYTSRAARWGSMDYAGQIRNIKQGEMLPRAQGPGRKPGASLYTRKRFSLSLPRA